MFSLPRFFQNAQRLPYAYRLGLAASIALYLALYAGLLTYARALPYVMDNNESFSAFVHAANLYHFPFSRTLGLTDEAFSPSEAAHPYVYTHQGNFPRVFAFVLYVLGARTIESQIVITTFTVGLLAIFLLYHYFATIGDPLFAFIAAAVAMTDYVFFVQWQVNTFRVWHGLFFYLALVCVHGMERGRRRNWLALTVATFACLFYFELVFAAFVAIMAGLYAGLRYRRRPRLLLWYWAAQSAGAAIAVIVLVGQLIGYLGWADFLQDLQLTYTARNLVAQDPSYIERIQEFVETRRLAFWYNFANIEYRGSPAEILSSITRGYFTVYTPTLWYLVTIVTVGWLAGFGRRRSVGTPETDTGTQQRRQEDFLSAAVATPLLVVCWTRFLLAVVQDGALTGVTGPRLIVNLNEQPWVVVVAAAMAGGLTSVVGRITTGGSWGIHRLSAVRLALAAATLLLAEHVVLNSATLFDPFYRPLWSDVQQTWFPGWIVQLVIVAAASLAVILSLNSWVSTETRWRSLASYLICGLLAYVVVYSLSPGYIQSGYLQRSSPFVSFVFQTAIALTIYAAWRAALPWLVDFAGGGPLGAAAVMQPATETMPDTTEAPGRWHKPAFSVVLRPRSSRPFVRTNIRVAEFWQSLFARAATRTAAGMIAAIYIMPLLFSVFFWATLQMTHVKLLPATHFVFVKGLAKPPFRGASFAANTYAAPIYAYTGQWAYFDTRLGLPDGGIVSATDEGYVVNRDARSYLWLADRQQNADYLRPSYFLCFSYQDLSTAVRRLQGREMGCSSSGAVKYANSWEQLSVAGEIVARDSSREMMWAVVKLDWSVSERRAGRSSSEARLE